ncbi:NrfD/PsrC family molybdoenzyme membrane anchor subunit [Patulibacter americanus]|uniref:NrfD/PsrC family molybdoenzyme membrane anchor subunit n=1 Tax=Patulibacter americanus TaxID=588672 RepID=UPI0012F735F3|nr:NrfD/PsrC family molybdoenzyme membrane anchor subunit [Patulibacter americanus]
MSTVPPHEGPQGPDEPEDDPIAAALRSAGGTRTGSDTAGPVDATTGKPVAPAGQAPITGRAPAPGIEGRDPAMKTGDVDADSPQKAGGDDGPQKAGDAPKVSSGHREIRTARPEKERSHGRGSGGGRTGDPGRSKRRRGGKAERSMVPDAEPRSYYGRQVVKTPVWTWEVPWYFFTGGMAGASALLATGARFTGNVRLGQSASAVALVGTAVSPVLLIMDLGRPARFLNMLRVFKITSPMSVGTWGLSLLGGSAGAAAGWQLLNFPPAIIGVPSQAAAGVFGPFVSVYTAVLLTTTATPVWTEARRTMPFVFAGSSLASAGGAATALTPVAHAAPARAMGVAGGLLETLASTVMERRLDHRIAASYEHPTVRPLNLAAKACALGGAAVVGLAGHRSRPAAVAGGALLMAGSALERWAIFKAGKVSAEDPIQTIGPQRDRVNARGTDAVAPE